jgi:hypothetical protein
MAKRGRGRRGNRVQCQGVDTRMHQAELRCPGVAKAMNRQHAPCRPNNNRSDPTGVNPTSESPPLRVLNTATPVGSTEPQCPVQTAYASALHRRTAPRRAAPRRALLPVIIMSCIYPSQYGHETPKSRS